MRYAVILTSTGAVQNVIELDDPTAWSTPDGCTLVQSDAAGPGYTYANGVFTEPAVTTSTGAPTSS